MSSSLTWTTSLGPVVASAHNGKLVRLMFADDGQESIEDALDRSPAKSPAALQNPPSEPAPEAIAANDAVLALARQQLDEYVSRKRQDFSVPLHLEGTAFQQSVWQALLAIPYGHTRSYQEQAIQMRQPLAIRAIAAANGRNPIAVLVPCHRVLGAGGKLTGYRGGLWRKQALLDLERPGLFG